MPSHFYFANRVHLNRFINRWDLLLLLLFFSLIFFLSQAGKQMVGPYQLGEPLPISLDPSQLPFYALRTVLRMFIALFFSLVFTFTFGTLAAKNKRAEQLIIPTIDVLQSVPVLSFLSITVMGFIHLFPGSLLGPECAAIFAIFTAQVWNIIFGFYQSLKTLPTDLIEAASMFQLTGWQRFWKIEVPFSMSSLLWNLMISMSASWFFVVLSEAIVISHQNIRLPGVGSYIALAIEEQNLPALSYAIFTMMVVIFLYDQILFRPLVAWSEKFKMDFSPDEEEPNSWLIHWLRSSRLIKQGGEKLNILKDNFINPYWLLAKKTPRLSRENVFIPEKHRQWLFNACLFGLILFLSGFLLHFVKTTFSAKELLKVFFLGSITSLRIIILMLLSSLMWIPIGVWIGLRPKLAQKIQPIIQFAAAFPANLFYPLFVIAIVRFHLNVEIWITPLMILGTQWYILFNVIAGASLIPRELYLAAENLNLKGWLWWKRLALPGIFPFYITGAIAASGGTWNASIVAEWVSWGQTTLKATGLGEYIQASTLAGDMSKIVLGTVTMCIYVLIFNHLIWRPLYRLAIQRYHLN